ncbi:MAG: nucleotide sugar dehydrogenase [Actinobacteria bacterium]|nr:nucleotide sugar dehydrogenase [Actinomycetota bacterium]
MRISVFGLGYVGSVSAACLANARHEVIGVDPDASKVDLINRGLPPVIEADLAELTKAGVETGRLKATTNPHAALSDADLAVVAVGTRSQRNGSIDLSFVRRVAEQIGELIRDRDDYLVIAIRSTILPGTTYDVVIPALEETSGKQVGQGFGVSVNPEFLREGTSVHDFYHPPKIIIGAIDEESFNRTAAMFAEIKAPMISTDVEQAELAKYVDNAWHALKVGFANEVGRLSKVLGIDSHQVMATFVQDTTLNISDKYLRPGFAFGGSCLPKDLRAVTYLARQLDVGTPILDAILPSNIAHIQEALDMITKDDGRKIAILGLSFKAGTDDVRESPMVEIVERLIGKGYDLRIYDPDVSLAALVGANREYLLGQIPHISSLLVGTLEEAVVEADTVVVGNGHESFRAVTDLLDPSQTLIDFVRISTEAERRPGYDGIAW